MNNKEPKKASEIFEGENSSLRKTFNEAVTPPPSLREYDWKEMAKKSAEYSNLSQNIRMIVWKYEDSAGVHSSIEMADKIINLCKKYDREDLLSDIEGMKRADYKLERMGEKRDNYFYNLALEDLKDILQAKREEK